MEINLSKRSREWNNLKVLVMLFTKYGVRLGIVTLFDALIRRMNIKKAYRFSHYYRYEECKNYLRKNYGEIIESFKKKNSYSSKIKEDAIIWVFWWQGIDNIPFPVGDCIRSIKRHSGLHKVVFLDKNNYMDYVRLPDYVVQKFEEGRMLPAHFSDVLRIYLLHEYGGIWIDSTIYLTEIIDKICDNHSFFTNSNRNEKSWLVSKNLWSVSFLAVGERSLLIDFCYEFITQYWLRENIAISYLLLDCIIAIAYESIPYVKKEIDLVPSNNLHVNAFLDNWSNEEYNQEQFREVTKNTIMFKLTYKKDYLLRCSSGKTNIAKLLDI